VERGVDMIAAAPGRLVDFIERGKVPGVSYSSMCVFVCVRVRIDFIERGKVSDVLYSSMCVFVCVRVWIGFIERGVYRLYRSTLSI